MMHALLRLTVAKRQVEANHAVRREGTSSTRSREVRFHRVGLEQVPISGNISPSPAPCGQALKPTFSLR